MRLTSTGGLSQSFLLRATNPFLLSPQPAGSSPPQALPWPPSSCATSNRGLPPRDLPDSGLGQQPAPPSCSHRELLRHLAELPDSSGGRGPHPCGHCLHTLHDGSRPEAAEVPALLTPTCPHLHQGRKKIGKATEEGVRITTFHLEPSPLYQSPRSPCSSLSNRGLSGPTQPEAIQNGRRFFI